VSNVVRLAGESKIPIHYGNFTPQLVRRIRTLSPDAILAAAYSYRVPVAELGIKFNLNVHPTLLPHGRGPNPIPYLAGEHSQFSGLTVHEMSPRFDEGAIVAQQVVSVQEGWGFNELALAMYSRAPDLVNQVLDDLDELFANRRPQGEGSYWPRPSRGDRTVSWHESAAAIAAKSRMFGSVGLICSIDGKEHNVVHPITAVEIDHGFECGRVVLRSPGIAYVAVSGGIVRVVSKSADSNGLIPWRDVAARAYRRAARVIRPTRTWGLHSLTEKFLENIEHSRHYR
jgi:methionyl-tRNA formyltransferase